MRAWCLVLGAWWTARLGSTVCFVVSGLTGLGAPGEWGWCVLRASVLSSIWEPPGSPRAMGQACGQPTADAGAHVSNHLRLGDGPSAIQSCSTCTLLGILRHQCLNPLISLAGRPRIAGLRRASKSHAPEVQVRQLGGCLSRNGRRVERNSDAPCVDRPLPRTLCGSTAGAQSIPSVGFGPRRTLGKHMCAQHVELLCPCRHGDPCTDKIRRG